ncbi:hypothetical protein [Sinomonas humi]
MAAVSPARCSGRCRGRPLRRHPQQRTDTGEHPGVGHPHRHPLFTAGLGHPRRQLLRIDHQAPH